MAYSHKSGMIDNNKVSDNHQEGIKRKLMRKGELCKGQGGKMGGHHSEKGFGRDKGGMSPKKA